MRIKKSSKKKVTKKKASKKKKKKVAAKAIGGKARAAALSPERRRRIAIKAITARWGTKATHRGNFKDEFGIDVQCYVLDDEHKTAVISQRGMAAALGMSVTGGGMLTRFLTGETISDYVGADLVKKLQKPLFFQWQPAAPKGPVNRLHGYDVTFLIDVCKLIIRADADGKLQRRSQQHIVRQAQVIVGASAKAGIKGLVYALAGYDATRAEIIKAFQQYVEEEAREYEKEFPDQLYAEWYRLYEIPKQKKTKPWRFSHLTIDQVYNPLAQSNGKILELAKARKAKSADRHAKIHQFLSGIGVKALRTHLGQLLGIAQVSDDKEEYERRVQKVFGAQQVLIPRGKG